MDSEHKLKRSTSWRSAKKASKEWRAPPTQTESLVLSVAMETSLDQEVGSETIKWWKEATIKNALMTPFKINQDHSAEKEKRMLWLTCLTKTTSVTPASPIPLTQSLTLLRSQSLAAANSAWWTTSWAVTYLSNSTPQEEQVLPLTVMTST